MRNPLEDIMPILMFMVIAGIFTGVLAGYIKEQKKKKKIQEMKEKMKKAKKIKNEIEKID